MSTSTTSPDLRPVRDYLRRMAEIRSTGGATSETSYYSALETLLNEIGKSLQPQVVCNSQLRDQGAGRPDFGLFSLEQCGTIASESDQIPQHGVVEVKGLNDNVVLVAKSKQTLSYLDVYRYVLVTNYRDFLLLGKGEKNEPTNVVRYTLADSAEEFVQIEQHPQKNSKLYGPRLLETLRIAISQGAMLHRPQDFASHYAIYAREALEVLEKSDLFDGSSPDPLMSDLTKTLGIDFSNEKSIHFFVSTLVQTLFYGLFSAWTTHISRNGSLPFSWKSAAHDLTTPMVRPLFYEVANPDRIDELGIEHILDKAAGVLNRIDIESFVKSFPTTEASQHFYEPFLEAFDPKLRKELGVWYTPHEVVHYMVERVDSLLRTEFNKENGFADEDVVVLDPCCGTGTYIIEILKRIEKTLRQNNKDSLVPHDIKRAATTRIFGFEILSAPFVISHWQVSAFLDEIGAPLDVQKGERCAIYLTNALTGWDDPFEENIHFLYPQMEDERRKAEQVKQKEPILVIIGNPPYNSYTGTSPKSEGGILEPYKNRLASVWGVRKSNLDDLYVRFFRIAERRIEKSGSGILSYISNHSYTWMTSFVAMREHLFNTFDKIWIDGMNGDSRETGKVTPDGEPDPSVFSTPMNQAGIQVGTCIGTFVKRSDSRGPTKLFFRDFWGRDKRKYLVRSLSSTSSSFAYSIEAPTVKNKFLFRPSPSDNLYSTWPSLADISNISPLNGLMEKRRGALIDHNWEELEGRMRKYYDRGYSMEEFLESNHGLSFDAASFSGEQTRLQALNMTDAGDGFKAENIVRYLVRPFDIRYAYYTDHRPIWNSCRPTFWKHLSGRLKENVFFVSRLSRVARPEGTPVFFSSVLSDCDAFRGHARYFPFYTYADKPGLPEARVIANLSAQARQYLQNMHLPCPDDSPEVARLLWYHALAIAYSPKYLKANDGAIAMDWPRVPMPKDADALHQSASLGSLLQNILDTNSPCNGVTTGNIPQHLMCIGNISSDFLEVTAGWGRLVQKGKVFPGTGRIVTREWSSIERVELSRGFEEAGLNAKTSFELLGAPVDIYLNGKSCWGAVPSASWDYVIGSYQVIKKWLAYRELQIYGRALTPTEAREVTGMIRRLTSLILLSDSLDKNYDSCCADPVPWHTP